MEILILIGKYLIFALVLSCIVIVLAVRSMPIGRIDADQEPIEILEPEDMPECEVEGIDMRAYHMKLSGD